MKMNMNAAQGRLRPARTPSVGSAAHAVTCEGAL